MRCCVTGTNHNGIVLQERDRMLLRDLATMRVIDREQAQVIAGFRSVTRANARLLALTRAHLLNRFFVGTINGGKKSLYSLSQKGAELAQVSNTGLKRRADSILVGDAFIAHQLQVNRLHLAFKFGHGFPPGTRLHIWRSFREPLSTASPIIPDGYLEIQSPAKDVCMFAEVDLGTERLAIWKLKIEAYLRLAVSGEFQQRFRRLQFRVLIVTDSAPRVRSLRELIARYTEKLFWISSFDALCANGVWEVWAPVWLRPTGKEPQPLLGGDV